MQFSYPQFTIGDKKSLDDFGLYTERHWKLERPAVKRVYVSVPSRDGDLDMTDALAGEPRYNDRLLTFPLYSDLGYNDFLDLHSRVKNYCHGQRMKVVLPHFSDRYLMGRISVENYAWDGFGTIYFEVICEPWLYSMEATTVHIELTEALVQTLQNGINFFPTYESVLTNNGQRTVMPLITNDYPITFSYDNVTHKLSEGSRQFTDFKIKGGESRGFKIDVDFEAVPVPVVPNAPNFYIDTVTKTSFILTWGRAIAVGGIARYVISVNGSIFHALPTAFSQTFTGFLPNTPITVFIYAVSANEVDGDMAPSQTFTTLDYSVPSTPILRVTSVTQNTIVMTWDRFSVIDDPVDDEKVTTYEVYCNENLVVSYVDPTWWTITVGGPDNLYALDDGTAYQLYVVASSNKGKSSKSNTVTATTYKIPEAPQNIYISSITDIQGNTNWDKPTDGNIASAEIYYNDVLFFSGVPDTGAQSTVSGNIVWWKRNDTLAANTAYSVYAVHISEQGVLSPPSELATFTTLVPQPPPPITDLQITNVTQTSITLTWNGANSPYGISKYTIYDGIDQMTVLQEVPETTLTCTFTELAINTSYSYCMTATDENGNESSHSNVVTAVTQDYFPPTQVEVRQVGLWYKQAQFFCSQSFSDQGIQKYEFYVDDVLRGTVNGNPENPGVQIVDLSPNTTYVGYVIVTSNNGLSTKSGNLTIRTRNLPGKSIIDYETVTSNSISLYWTLPDLDGGAFWGYQLMMNETRIEWIQDVNVREALVSDLAPATAYTFVMVCRTREEYDGQYYEYYQESDPITVSTSPDGPPPPPTMIKWEWQEISYEPAGQAYFEWEPVTAPNALRVRRSRQSVLPDGSTSTTESDTQNLSNTSYIVLFGIATAIRLRIAVVDAQNNLGEWGPWYEVVKPENRRSSNLLTNSLSSPITNFALWNQSPDGTRYAPLKDGWATLTLGDTALVGKLSTPIPGIQPNTAYTLTLETKNITATTDFTVTVGGDADSILPEPIIFNCQCDQEGIYVGNFTTPVLLPGAPVLDFEVSSGQGDVDMKLAIYSQLPDAIALPRVTASIDFSWQEANL